VPEQFCDVGRGITLCYETFGDPADPPALLVMGLGTQMIAWQEDFCEQLAERGFYVLRFDNRDVGRSTHIHGRPPTPRQLLTRSKRAAHYLLGDMAEDAAGLLRELQLGSAHVIGASMGGMIAQTLAARNPPVVRSLTSIMSTTGSIRAGQPSPALYPIFLRRAPRGRDAFIEHIVRVFSAIGSRELPRDPEEIRELAARSYERDRDPAGTGRQLAAIIASGDRTSELHRIHAPTLVIHGTADRLVTPSGGRATARAIPGARLMTIPKMGHDLPRVVWPQVLDAIAALARGAEVAPANGRVSHAGQPALQARATEPGLQG
jgi:pimeloyl-ACP methyl ester carboxylesterase